MRKAIVVAVSAVIAVAAVAASVATADSSRVASPAAPNCRLATIATDGPYTGPAAAAGLDQRGWARTFLSAWNAGKAIPGVPKSMKRTKLKAIEVDTQLDAQLAATAAVQLRSNKDVLALNGFSGSQENVVGGPILRRGGMSMVSGSATRASLTDPSTPDGAVLKTGYFRRVVPTDKRQGATDAAFMLAKFGLKNGDKVLTVDSAEAYSVPLVTLISQALSAKGVDVDRQSQPAANTDFTSLANRAIAQKVKAVFWGGQVASNAQLFYKQLKSKGYSGGFMAPDGAFVQDQFNTPGAYISSFSLDIHDVPVAQPFVKAFEAKFGKTNSFGAPTFVAMQAIAEGVSLACADGKVSRAEVRKDIGKVKMPMTILGKPIAFDKFGDVVGGIGFTIFQIGNDGSYNVVQKG